MARDLPEQKVVESMIELQTPDRKHVIYYPQLLTTMAIQQKQYSVFHTSNESGTAHINALQDDGSYFRVRGEPQFIIDAFD